jgi:DNA polymerase-3 subunit beta
MKLICTQENFKKAILNVEKVTSKQITLPILKNILLETKDGRLIISATNLEIGVISKIGAKIERDGVVTIPARLISDFITNLPQGGNIELELDNQVLRVICGKYKAKINTIDPEDFPIIPKPKNDYQFSLNGDILKDTINKTLICINLNNTRVEFTGININFNDKEVLFASTDSFRLTEVGVNIKKREGYGEISGKSVIIPVETLREVNKILSNNNKEKQILVTIDNNQIFFNINDTMIVSRLINGNYPNYKQIIPDNFKTSININKSELLRSIKIASVFTKMKEGEINIKIKNNQLIIKSEIVETGENEVVIDIDKGNDDQEIVLNPKYLIDGLSTIETERVLLLINSSDSPFGIKMINNDNETVDKYIYIIMPINK